MTDQTDKKKLETLTEIAQFIEWSEDKVMSMHLRSSFPIRKIGGRWVSHKDVINTWVQVQITTKSSTPPKP